MTNRNITNKELTGDNWNSVIIVMLPVFDCQVMLPSFLVPRQYKSDLDHRPDWNLLNTDFQLQI